MASALARSLLLMGLAVLCTGVSARAPQQDPKPKFEVAQIREWAPGQMPHSYRNDVRRMDPVRVWGQYSPFRALLRYAFNLSGSEMVEGLPAWAGTKRANIGAAMFSIDARMPAATTDQQARLMMQSLLADQFKLAWHWTTRSAKTFDLMAAPEELKLARAKPAGSPEPPSGVMTCPAGSSGCMFMAPGDRTMAQFAGSLSGFLGRPVVDRTGLKGTFYFPFLTLAKPDESSAPVASVASQLHDLTGLGLRSGTDAVPALVVDHLEKPKLDKVAN